MDKDLAIEIKNLSVDYGRGKVFENFSLEVALGEAVLIKGRSGCGKSTLLHTICGLIPSVTKAEVSGDIKVFGKSVQSFSIIERAKEMGIVFQNPDTQLFCDTVEDEVAFGLENLCVPQARIGERIDEVLELVQMQKFRYASPKELSGGEKQRVVLASVLALSPRILLLDEALSQMDTASRGALIEHLMVLRGENYTMFMVDHDDVLMEVASRTVEL